MAWLPACPAACTNAFRKAKQSQTPKLARTQPETASKHREAREEEAAKPLKGCYCKRSGFA